MKGRQSTSGHTQLRHGHHKWLKDDFPFWQAYQSLHSVMEAKVKWARSTAFASSNHQRDVFKESGRGGEVERLHTEVLTIMVCLNGGILPVYPAAEGNRHFVWGHPVNIPPTGGRSGSRGGCDSVFIIPWRDLPGEGGSWPQRQRWKLHQWASEEAEKEWMMETVKSDIKHRNMRLCGFLSLYIFTYLIEFRMWY